MKMDKPIPNMRDLLSETIDIRINETVGVMPVTNPAYAKKYTPTSIRLPDALRRKHADIDLSQPDHERVAPATLAFPFDGMYDELIKLYVALQGIYTTAESGTKMGNLSPAKKKATVEITNKILNVEKQIREIIQTVERITL